MKNFKAYKIINATPEEVYAALTNEATMQLWTGEKAEMVAAVGAEFSMWDGSICGKNLELVPGAKIVQEWFFGDDLDEQSIVTIKMHPHKKGTSLEVNHTNIPDEDYKNIAEGWEDVYLSSLVKFYE